MEAYLVGFGFTPCIENNENVYISEDGSIDNVTFVYIEGEKNDEQSIKTNQPS